MAKLPSSKNINRPTPQGAGGVASYSPTQVQNVYGAANIAAPDVDEGILGEVADTIENVKSDYDERQKKAKKEQDKHELARASSEWMRSQVEIDRSFDGDNNYSEYQAKYSDSSMSAKQKILQGISDPNLRNAYSMQLDDDIFKGNRKMEKRAKVVSDDVRLSSDLTSIEELNNLIKESDNPEEIAKAKNIISVKYDNLYSSQIISNNQKRQYKSIQDKKEADMDLSTMSLEKQLSELATDAKSKTIGDRFSPSERDKRIKSVKSQIEVRDNKIVSLIDKETSNVTKGQASGHGAQDKISLMGQGSSNPKIQMAYAKYEQASADQKIFEGSTPREMEQNVNILNAEAVKDGATPMERFRADNAQKYKDNMINDISKDSIGYAVKTGALQADDVAPIDLRSPASMSVRKSTADAVQASIGHTNFFTPQEVPEIQKQYNGSNPQEKAAIIADIAENAEGHAYKAFDEILGDAPREQYIAGMVAGDRSSVPAAATALHGVEMINADPALKMTSDIRRQIKEESSEYTSGLDVRNKKALEDSAYAYILGKGGDPEDLSGLFADTGDINEALRVMSGGLEGDEETGIAEINNKKIILPQGVRRSDFDSAYNNIRPEEIIAYSSNGLSMKAEGGEVDFPAEDIKKGTYLVSIGKNAYGVMSTLDNAPIVDQNGTPFVLILDSSDIRNMNTKRLIRGEE